MLRICASISLPTRLSDFAFAHFSLHCAAMLESDCSQAEPDGHETLKSCRLLSECAVKVHAIHSCLHPCNFYCFWGLARTNRLGPQLSFQSQAFRTVETGSSASGMQGQQTPCCAQTPCSIGLLQRLKDVTDQEPSESMSVQTSLRKAAYFCKVDTASQQQCTCPIISPCSQHVL